jgi:hypothetical protein
MMQSEGKTITSDDVPAEDIISASNEAMEMLKKRYTIDEINNIFDKIIANHKKKYASQETNEEEEHILKAFALPILLKKCMDKNEYTIILESLMSVISDQYMIGNNDVEIKESTVHVCKEGLFATEDIEENEVITFYPAHCVADYSMTNEKNKNLCKHYFPENQQFKVDENYKLKVNDRYSIIGNSKETSNMKLLGHIINDSNTCDISVTEINEDEIKNTVKKYMTESNNNCSVIINEDVGICYIKTLKPVKKGEEFFMSYDAPHWLTGEQQQILISLLRKDEELCSFIIENNKSSGKREIEHVIGQIYRPKYLKSKKIFKKFIVYMNENKISLPENTSKKIQKLIRELSNKNVIFFDFKNRKTDIESITESIDLKDKETKELWYSFVETTK